MKAASTSPTSSSLAKADFEECPLLYASEVADRLKVMRRQEDTIYFCPDYLKETKSPRMINELYRTKMVMLCFQCANYEICKRENVIIAISYLDRFLSSGTPRAINTIKNRKDYQLATMTTL